MLLEILLIFGLSIWNCCDAHLETPELCVVSSPLVTPYFTPWLETPRKARGCWATPRGANIVEVHVLVLRGLPVSSWVNLDVIGHELRNNLVLVLMSTHSVNWKVTTRLPHGAIQPHVMVSNGSTLESYVEFNTSQHEWRNRRALQRYLQQKFKTVASYTEVHGANRLELNVGLSWPQDHCNVHSRSESRVVTASQAVQIKTEGCFHKSYIGDNSMDVYIVELDAGESHSGRGERADRSSMPVVLIHLHEGGESAELLTELYNLTLVLKSSVPVRWRFGHTPRNTGKIVVVSNEGDQIENEDHPGLSVRLVRLPDRLDDLLLSVTTEFGPPVLYARTGRASTLNLIVGTCSDKGCSGDPMKVIPVSKIDDTFPSDGWSATEDALSVMQQQPVSSNGNFHNLKADEVRTEILAQLKEVMIINCSEKRFTVSFPLFIVQRLGSPLISFSDRSCTAVANRTHMTLTSPLTSCGSTSKIDRGLTAFYNYVHVSLVGLLETNGDVYNAEFFGDLGESEGIPVVCKNQPYYIGGKIDVDDGSEFDTVEHDGIKHKSLYNLELYRDKGFQQPLNFHSANIKNEVRIGERLFVRAWMEGGGTKVQLVTENCWLTNSSDPKSKIRMFLLRNACPADLCCVSLLEQHGSFSFQTGHKFDALGPVYLHCRIGMCTHLESLTKGNLALCVDTKQHCLKPNSLLFANQTTVSTAQQIVTRGPIFLVPHYKSPVSSIEAIPSPTSAEAVFPQVVNMSTNCVSIQTTVAIALTSFVIGIVLMIIIWFIHVKTDPLRHRTKQLQQAGGMTSANIAAGGTVFSGLSSSVCSTANL